MDFDIFVLAKQIFDAVMGGQWTLVAALALMLVVFALRKFGAARLPWLASDAGGAVAVLLTSVLGAVATALTAGEVLSPALLLKALQVGFAAAGGWAVLKKALLPLGMWLLTKLGLQSKPE